MLEHPDLPPVLVADVARGLLPSQRLRVDDRAAAALHQHVRKREVVAEPRV